jgi:hypothetical protein
LSRALSCIRVAIALTAIAVVAAGCAAGNNASQASNSEQPYKTMYGMTSDGTTTDLYTEIFGTRQATPAPATTVAAAEPISPPQQPAAASNTVPPAAKTAKRQNQTQTQTAASRATPPAPVQPAPVQVAQQPASPPPPEEPDVPTAYGITAKGPSTDLYTAIFGPRNSGGQ